MPTFDIGFDWGNLPVGSKFVDVGGGVGTQAMILAREYPHLKYVVQDRAEVIANAKQVSQLSLVSASLTYASYFARYGQLRSRKLSTRKSLTCKVFNLILR